MKPKYFYLLLGCREEADELSVGLSLEKALRNVFGECGASSVCVDILSVQGPKAVVRVNAQQLRKVRAAITLDSPVRVLAHSVSLQALL